MKLGRENRRVAYGTLVTRSDLNFIVGTRVRGAEKVWRDHHKKFVIILFP